MRVIPMLLLVAAISGCAGTNFDFDQARRVKVGMTSAELTQVMGKPYSITASNGAEIWVWSRANGFTGSSRAVSFVLRNGVVQSVPVIPYSFDGSKRQIASAVLSPTEKQPESSQTPSTAQGVAPSYDDCMRRIAKISDASLRASSMSMCDGAK